MQVFDLTYKGAPMAQNENIFNKDKLFKKTGAKETDEIRIASLRDDELLIDEAKFVDDGKT